MTALLSPRVWLVLALAAVLAFSHLTVYRSGRASVRHEWDAERAQQEREANAAAARNRDLQRAAELRYVVKRDAQAQFFVTTIKEIDHAAAPLADCPVPDAVRVRLNAAAACARGDSPAACGAAGAVPGP